MATLILSTVGKIFGPIGAAIGAVAGQAIDTVLFKPKGRQGPRLTELSVQTSSYGTQLPKIFGTMRVAGCVIWSTDLIESRSTSSSGKGQPSTTNYSYVASFAVALSGRPIVGVGRIWADGKLLRGASGDFKTMTGFRLHLGSEEQTADPVIAAAEGGMAPAHRGIAYAVFENFQLGEYGNRLPSLTFEVIGDAAPLAIGHMAAALGEGVITSDATLPPLGGFSAYGDSIRGVIETLAVAGGARFVPEGGRLLMTATNSPTATLNDDGYGLPDRQGEQGLGERGLSTLAAIERVPKTVTVAHYDPARDFQTGLQRARRPGAGHRDDRIDMPAALSAGAAKTLAEASLSRAENERAARMLKLSWANLAVVPGRCVTIAGEAGAWRVAKWTLEQRILTLDCTLIAPATAPAIANSGRVLASPDVVAGPTILHAFELPALDDTVLSAPRMTIAAGGATAGWRRSALLYSIDNGASWISAGPTAAPATIGMMAAPLDAASAVLIDDRSVLDVVLTHDGLTLAGADDRALANGANMALVGEELIQFGRAVQTGSTRWRLTRLLRGRRGTEAAIGSQTTGDRFVLIDPGALVAIDLPLASLGSNVRVLATGVGDSAGPAMATLLLTGRSVLPLAPVHLEARMQADGGAAVRWIRRSRGGWRWIDRVDSPLAEEREDYRVTIEPISGPARSVMATVPEITLTPDEIVTGARITVVQRGSYGESPSATIDLPPA